MRTAWGWTSYAYSCNATARRFRCDAVLCERQIFTERSPYLMDLNVSAKVEISIYFFKGSQTGEGTRRTFEGSFASSNGGDQSIRFFAQIGRTQV